jgi:hypothetical protein
MGPSNNKVTTLELSDERQLILEPEKILACGNYKGGAQGGTE